MPSVLGKELRPGSLEATALKMAEEFCREEFQKYTRGHVGVNLVLRQVVLRLRWQFYFRELSYNFEGIRQCLRARLLLGLFEYRIMHTQVLYQAGLSPGPSHPDHLLTVVWPTLFTLFQKSKCEKKYLSLLMGRILELLYVTKNYNCQPVSLILTIGAEENPVGAHLSTHDERLAQTYIHLDYLARTHMNDLLHQKIHPRKCWECHSQNHRSDRMTVCGGCRLARYCSTGCQASHWPTHRESCKFWQKHGSRKQRQLIETLITQLPALKGKTYGEAFAFMFGHPNWDPDEGKLIRRR